MNEYVNEKTTELKKSLSSLERKKIAKYDQLRKQMYYSISRMQRNGCDFYILQVVAEWQKGTDMIMRSRVISDYSKCKALLTLYRLTSLNELYKYIHNLYMTLNQTELFL